MSVWGRMRCAITAHSFPSKGVRAHGPYFNFASTSGFTLGEQNQNQYINILSILSIQMVLVSSITNLKKKKSQLHWSSSDSEINASL